MSSPSIYLAPAHLTDADILSQTVALALLKAVWEQAAVQHGHGIRRALPLLYGLRLWQIWEMGLNLSGGRDDVLQWAYGHADANTGEPAIALPARYHELCAAHRIWMITPVNTGVPLYCDLRDGTRLRRQYLAESLTSPDSLKEIPRYQSEETAFRLQGKSLAMATVIDYMVATYGRQSLPALVAALGHHDSWETLAPDLFGVSLGEFQPGWRQHVASMILCSSGSACP